MTTHPQLARLHIPHQGSPVSSALFTPSLPTALQQSYNIATPLNTSFGSQLPPHPHPRHGMHRNHPSLMFPGPAAGIAPPSGMPITPSGMPSHMMFGTQSFQRGSRRTSSISTGGPPKALLGGPQRKHSPMPAVVPANPLNALVTKLKKVVVKLPAEKLQLLSEGTEATEMVYSLWSRKPLPHTQAPRMDHVDFPEAMSMDTHPIEQSSALPATIDVFLPGKGAWDEYKQNLIEMKLQRLGVERGGNSAPPGQSHVHARATSISSPADPALLLFKLNKLQQSQAGSLSVSPQPSSSSIPVSPNPLPPRFQQNIVPRHGHSFSLANLNPPQLYNPSSAFNPFGPTATLGSDSVIGQGVPDTSSFPNGIEHDPPPHLHAPQGVVPLSLNMQSDTRTVSSSSSRVASTVPDFIRGFGLDIPEEDEEELEAFGNTDTIGMLPLDEGSGDEMNGAEDDATTAGAHSRHVSRVSIALSLKSMGGRSGRMDVEDITEETSPPELDNPVEWSITDSKNLQDTTGQRDTQVDADPAEEWTGSEDNGSFEEFSNPSDEERVMQARKKEREARARQRTYQDHETPRRLPEFPRPPEGGPTLIPHAPSTADDDIVSNPSEEGKMGQSDWLFPGQHQQDPAYFQPVEDGQPRSPRPLPPLPHSRTASANVSYPSTMQHSRHTSSRVNDSELPSSANGLPRRDSLNPFAKPFVFGAVTSSGSLVTNSSSEIAKGGHTRQPSSGRTLNAAAAEFKPGFTFLPPAGVPKLSFPVAEAPRPLPDPPLGISPSRMQGREKRQRRGSSAASDQDTDDDSGRDAMSSFKFPPSNPPHLTGLHAPLPTLPIAQRPISPMPLRKSELNATAPPFKFPGVGTLSFASNEPPTLPYPFMPLSPVDSQTMASGIQHSTSPTPEETNGITSDIAISIEQSSSPARKRPPVLDFKHPVSTNTVPASLFRRTLMSNDLEGPTRATVRSRLSSREIYEHMSSPSLDDTNVPTISRKSNVSQQHMTEDPHQNHSDFLLDQATETFTSLQYKEPATQEHKLPVPTSGIISPISESMLSSYTRRREEAEQIEQRLEDMLDDRMELAKKDLTEAHGQAADQIVGQVITALRTQLSELATHRSEDGAADARGEVDFELIRNTLEQGVMDIRTGLRRDLEEVLRTVESAHMAREGPASGLSQDFHRIMEEFGSRTVSAVTNAVVKFAARIDQIDEFARVRASDERELLLSGIFNVLAPRLDSLRQQPIDFDVVTAKLAEAVKPHISQLIDLTSDKKETAGLILQRLMPALSSLSQTPAHVDTDAIVSQLRVEVARMAPASDPHVIKEAVADLVVERLDSRLAVREKSASNEGLYSRISECIDDLHVPVSDVRKAVEELRMGQESIQEQGAMLNTLHQDMASHLLGLPGTINTAVEAIHAASERLMVLKNVSTSVDLNQILPQLQSIDSTMKYMTTNQESLMSQSTNLVSLHNTLHGSVTSLPNTLSEAVASLKQAQIEFLSQNQFTDQSGEIRSLSAANAELQVQLAKARGAHGQIRVEKDLMGDRMATAETERDSLRCQLEELKSRNVAKETEVAATGLRIAELEDALSHALARLQSSEVTDKAKTERISTLEQQNRDLGLEQFQLKSQIQKLELQEGWLARDKDNLEQRLSQLQKDRDSFAHQQSHWEELRRTSDQVEQLTRLIGAADSAEVAELKRASDRSKVLEGEHASLQKRFKEQESKIANIERASQTARQGMAQAQQRASEWEKRTTELEADLDAARTRLDDAEEAKLQLDSDLSLVKMHLEEKEAADGVTKDREIKLCAEVSSLESQLSGLKSELENLKLQNLKLENLKQARQNSLVTTSAVSPSPPNWGTNSYGDGREPRPSSRASTVYGGRSPVTPTDVSYRTGKFPSRAPSVAPDSPKGVWGSMHAPRTAQRPSTTLPYPPRSAIPSPTPSTVSLAPTQGDDGWWS